MIIYRYEMGYKPEEFASRLPAVGSVVYDPERMLFVHDEAERRWTLQLSNVRVRSIALIRLPVVDVELAFEGYTPSEADAIVQRFHAYFRRGGG